MVSYKINRLPLNLWSPFLIMLSGLYFEYFIIKSSEEQNPFSSPKSLSSQYHLWKKPPHTQLVICCIICIYRGLFPPTVISYPFLPENIFHYANSIIHVNIRYRFPSLIVFKVCSACFFFQTTWSSMAWLGEVMLTCPPALGRLRQGDCRF